MALPGHRISPTADQEHPMKKIVALLAICTALAACDDKAKTAETTAPAAASSGATQPETKPAAAPETPAPAAAPAEAPAAQPAEQAPAQTTEAKPEASAASALPKECDDYIARVKACVAKAGGSSASEQFEKSLDQAKSQWDAVQDKSQLAPACTAANEQFNQMVGMLKCE